MADPIMHDEVRLRYEADAGLIRAAMEACASRILNAMSWRRKLRGALAALPALVGIAVVAVAIGLAGGGPLDPLSLVVGILIGGAVAFLTMRRASLEVAEANAAACGSEGPLELVLAPGGIVETSGAAEIRVPWRAVDAVVKLRRGLGICFGAMVIPVPDTALPAGWSRDDLSAFVERHREAAR